MDNMELYNALRTVPPEAMKTIGAGRLKGMTDINPMWRIKALTERFGPCGIGWKYIVTGKTIEYTPEAEGQEAGMEAKAFVDIDLYYMYNGAWSDPVPGTGGSSFVSQEKGGRYVSDECYKMALTDAISVAAKALGVGADVYFAKDCTKYIAPDRMDNGAEPGSPMDNHPYKQILSEDYAKLTAALSAAQISPEAMTKTIAKKYSASIPLDQITNEMLTFAYGCINATVKAREGRAS